MTSPSAILLAGGGAAVTILAGLPLLAAAGIGALAWAGRVAFAIPRAPRREHIDPFALADPWRGFVHAALQAQARFDRTVQSAKAGPLRDRLAEIGERVETGVNESWHVANRAQEISTAIEQLDTKEAKAQLAALAQDTTTSSESRTSTEESLRAQIASADRMDAIVRDARDRLRLLDARLDEAAARAVELSVDANDEGMLGLSSDVDNVVSDMEALRQALEETGTAPAGG
jgi:chromosome segregation ATPase